MRLLKKTNIFFRKGFGFAYQQALQLFIFLEKIVIMVDCCKHTWWYYSRSQVLPLSLLQISVFCVWSVLFPRTSKVLEGHHRGNNASPKVIAARLQRPPGCYIWDNVLLTNETGTVWEANNTTHGRKQIRHFTGDVRAAIVQLKRNRSWLMQQAIDLNHRGKSRKTERHEQKKIYIQPKQVPCPVLKTAMQRIPRYVL